MEGAFHGTNTRGVLFALIIVGVLFGASLGFHYIH